MNVSRHRLIITAAVLAAVAIALVYYFVDPATSIMPRCTFKQFTGWDCPGCGSQRAFHALLRGHIAEAWSHNPALFVMIPLAAVYGYAELTRRRHPRLHAAIYRPAAIAAIGLAIIAWTVARNIWL